MREIKKKIQIAGTSLLPLVLAGCFQIHIVKGTGNPNSHFERAYSQIEKIHREYPQRSHRAHRLYVLVYDRSSTELIQVSVPVWFVDACLSLGMKTVEWEGRHRFEERYDFDWKAIKDLGQFGPGLLAEVDDENDRVLVWLK